ncbi:MAG: hypothetical protein ACKO27_06420 [Ilumatobacteraceae bacterium]
MLRHPPTHRSGDDPDRPASRRRARPIALLAALVLAGTAAAVASVSRSDDAGAARTPRTGASDMFVFSTEQDLGDEPSRVSRVSAAGELRWVRPVGGVDGTVFLGLHSADRNVTEDALYIQVSTYDRHLLDGRGQLQRYDARGEMTWAVGIEGLGSDVMVSADPVGGGAWVSTSAGITRVDKRGAVVWGPLDFGLGSSAGQWGVAVDTSDGSAFATAYAGDRVLKVEPIGDVRWQIELDQPGVPMFSPLDHGAYIGTHSYFHDTVKLSRTGRVEWVKYALPTPYTYGRAVNPVDGSLYIVSGWASYLVQVSRTGRTLADIYISNGWGPIGNQGLEVSLDGRYLYTANSAEELALDANSVSWDHLTRRWRFEPGWYEMTSNAYAPFYRPFVGMPRVP